MDIYLTLRDAAFGVLGFDRALVKDAAYQLGLGPLWEVLRNVIFHPYALLAVPACLLLERLVRVFRRDRVVTPGMVLDSVYPVLNMLTMAATLDALLIVAISGLVTQHVPFVRVDLLSALPPVPQAIAVFLVVDLVFYWGHRLHHTVAPLWYLHAVHHSQEDLNPFTTYRSHPLERVTKSLLRTAPLALLGGTPATVFWFAFPNTFWSFFIHSNIRLSLGPLKYVIVTPQYHRVHHSIESQHFDLNYGERLVVWDWMFGTLWRGFDDYPATGVKGFTGPKDQSVGPLAVVRTWWGLTLYPFRRAWAEWRASKPAAAEAAVDRP